MYLGKDNGKRISVFLMTLAVWLSGCSGESETVRKDDLVPVVAVNDSSAIMSEQLTRVAYGDVVKRELYDGVVVPYMEELYFSDTGTFLEYTVTVGDEVKRGQVLARTDTTAIQKQVEVLEEQLADLQRDYTYQLESLKLKEELIGIEMEIHYLYLDETNYPSTEYTQLCMTLGQQSRSLARNQLEQKQLTERYELELLHLTQRVEKLKQEINSNVIKSPFAGVIVEIRTMAGGENVNEKEAYLVLADPSRYLVVSDYVGANVIKKAEGISAFMNGNRYELQYLEPDKDNHSKTMTGSDRVSTYYEIEPDGSFDFGQYVKIDVVRESKRDVLVVPSVAVQVENDARYCYVKRGTEREKVYIETGLNDGVCYEVKGGLAEGDEVYIE